MSYRFELVTAPTQEPVSLSEAKAHLRYPDSDEDDLIQGLIEAARRLIESQTSRQLVTATWKVHYDGFFREGFTIRKHPVKSISSITYYDVDGVSQTWATDQYQTDLVSVPARIWLAYGVSYPSIRSGKLNPVTVTFTAGDSPANVDQRAKQAILLTVSHWFWNRETVAMGVTPSEVPWTAQVLIDSLKWTAYAGVV